MCILDRIASEYWIEFFLLISVEHGFIPGFKQDYIKFCLVNKALVHTQPSMVLLPGIYYTVYPLDLLIAR